jgi:LCP family protein required for cell wall assembly
MHKRSKRFGLILVTALVACMAAAMLMITGCGSEPEDESSPAMLAPQDKEPTVQVTLPTEPFYVLVVGNDSRADTAETPEGNPYSDTIMLARVDPTNYQVTLVSIARDTQIWMDGEKYKMNSSYSTYGIDGLTEQVEALTGADVTYYLDMGFADFINFVDAIGGVDVYVPVPMDFKDVMGGGKIYLDEGDQHLDGRSALVFSRVRKIFAEEGEACRQTDDRSVVASILQSVASNPDTVKSAVTALLDNAETNWPREEFQALVEDFAKHADQLTVYTGTGPYWTDLDYDTELIMAVRDEDTWAQVMDVVNNGGDPNDVVTPPDRVLG